MTFINKIECEICQLFLGRDNFYEQAGDMAKSHFEVL